jgi:hypothetical protein
VGSILTHTGSAYAAAQADSAQNSEVIGIVSEVENSNEFTVQTSGLLSGLSGLTAGTVYFLSDTVAGAVTTTEPDISKPVYYSSSTTEATMLNFRGSDSTLTSGSGDMVLIDTQTVSSAVASVEFDLTGTSAYETVVIEITDVIPATDSVLMYGRTSSTSSSPFTFDSGASDYGYRVDEGSFGHAWSRGTSQMPLLHTSLLATSGSNKGATVTISIPNCLNTTLEKAIKITSIFPYPALADKYYSFGSIFRYSTSAVNAFQVYFSSGNISSGTFKLYGIK